MHAKSFVTKNVVVIEVIDQIRQSSFWLNPIFSSDQGLIYKLLLVTTDHASHTYWMCSEYTFKKGLFDGNDNLALIMISPADNVGWFKKYFTLI